MTLASSGEMSIGGTTANRSINLELGLAATANSSLNQTNFRSLAGVYGIAYPGQTAYAELIFNPNGSIQYGTSDGGIGGAGSWATPNTAGIGSSYWIRFTQTATSGGPITAYGSARGVWIQMSSVLYFGVSRTANGTGYFTYTVQIASDSGGSNIVATATNIELSAEIVF